MAEEFLPANQPETRDAFAAALQGVPTLYEPHVVFKKRVPQAIGLIRTADTTQLRKPNSRIRLSTASALKVSLPTLLIKGGAS